MDTITLLAADPVAITGVGTILSDIAANIGTGVNSAFTAGWPIPAGILAFFLGWKVFKRMTKGA